MMNQELLVDPRNWRSCEFSVRGGAYILGVSGSNLGRCDVHLQS